MFKFWVYFKWETETFVQIINVSTFNPNTDGNITYHI